MKMHQLRGNWLRHITVLGLLFSLFVGSSTFVLAGAPTAALSGEVTVSGTGIGNSQAVFMLNGEKAISGRTFIGSGTIATLESGATIDLGRLGMISLLPNSAVSLSLSDNAINGELLAGNIRVMNNEGVAVKINSRDNVVTSDPASAADFTVDVTSGKTSAESAAGSVMINGQKAADTDKDKKRRRAAWIWGGIIAGAVATVIIIWAVNRNDDVASPSR